MATTTDRRPRYVQELALRQRQDEAELVALGEGLTDLRRYLTSPKFTNHDDVRYGLVNVNDVLLRLDEAVSASLDARSTV
jgi:hypothetical protein